MSTVLNKGLSLNTKSVYAMPGKDDICKRNLCQKIKNKGNVCKNTDIYKYRHYFGYLKQEHIYELKSASGIPRNYLEDW